MMMMMISQSPLEKNVVVLQSKNCTVWEHSLSGQVWTKCPRPDTQGAPWGRLLSAPRGEAKIFAEKIFSILAIKKVKKYFFRWAGNKCLFAQILKKKKCFSKAVKCSGLIGPEQYLPVNIGKAGVYSTVAPCLKILPGVGSRWSCPQTYETHIHDTGLTNTEYLRKVPLVRCKEKFSSSCNYTA